MGELIVDTGETQLSVEQLTEEQKKRYREIKGMAGEIMAAESSFSYGGGTKEERARFNTALNKYKAQGLDPEQVQHLHALNIQIKYMRDQSFHFSVCRPSCNLTWAERYRKDANKSEEEASTLSQGIEQAHLGRAMKGPLIETPSSIPTSPETPKEAEPLTLKGPLGAMPLPDGSSPFAKGSGVAGTGLLND